MTTHAGTNGADLIDEADLGTGVDRIDGRGGDDTLIARDDATTLVGGGGDDVFVLPGHPDVARRLVVEDFVDGDAFFLASADHRFVLEAASLNDDGDASLVFEIAPANAESVRGRLDLTLQGGQDVFSRTDATVDGVRGDLYQGVVGEDALGGADSLILGAFAFAGSAGEDTVFGTADGDELAGGASGDLLYGQGGGDLLTGGEGADALFGGVGDDVLYGDGG